MRVLRYALIGLGGVLLLLAAALAYVLVFFDPNAHKQELERLVRDQTGRELQVAGDLKLRLYPWLAIEMGHASLGNAAGFGAEPMVEFDQARLGVKLLPLLHREIEIGAVTVEAPRIHLTVDAAGHDNWSDLGKGKSSEAPAAGVPKMSVASVRIVNGTLHYVDRQAGSDTEVRGLEVKTGALSFGQPFDLQLAGTIRKDKSLELQLDLRGRATLDPAASRYQLASPVIKLLLKGAALPAAGLPVEARFASATADLKAQTLELPGMELRAAGAQLTGALRGTKILDAPAFGGAVQLASVPLRGLLQKLDVRLPATRDPAVFGNVAWSGTLAASKQSIMVSGLKLRLDDTTATGRAGIGNLDTGTLDFDLRLDRINADRYLAPVPAASGGKGGAAPPAAPTPLPLELLRGLDMHGALRVGAAVFAGMQYQDLHLVVNAGGGRIRVFPSEARMYGGQYHGDIGIDATGRLARVSFDEHVAGVDFAPLFHDMFETQRISGRGNGALKATAVGADSAALLRTLTGTLEFHVDNGALEGADLWYEIRRARALLRQEAIPARTGPERTPFTAVSATARITNGVVANDDLIAALQYLQVKGHGTADIASGTLDYHLEATVLKIPDNAADAAGAADLSGFTVPVTVTGSFGAPKVRPDVEGLVKARVQKEIDKKKDELKQKLQDQLKDKLKGLFGN